MTEKTNEQLRQEQFNEEVAPTKPILDLTTLKAMFPQYAEWLDEEAQRRSKEGVCNCGNCLMVALRDEFGAEYPDSVEAFRLGWPKKDGYPEGWANLNRESLNEDGSGWEVRE